MDITLAPFAAQTTGMYYVISLNGSSESIYDGSQSQWADVFNVKVQAEEDSGNLLLIVVILVAVIGVLERSSSCSPVEAVAFIHAG